MSAALVALAAAMPAQRTQAPGELAELGVKAQEIVQAHVAGVVTIKVVIKIEFLGQSQEKRLEARGMLVTDAGLVMTDEGVVDPNVNVRSGGREIQDVTATAEDIKIVFGNEEEEQDAFLVGKDSKLGFAFLQVRGFDAKKRSIPVPDYDAAKEPKVGSIVVTPNRLEKGFDYAPYFTFGWITGEVKKPRKALLLSSGTNNGLPAYDLAGNLVGAHARLSPSVGDDKPRAVLLKGGVVNGAIQQAAKRAEEMLEEHREEKGASGDGK
jgi:S1-C subfamily serine protease